MSVFKQDPFLGGFAVVMLLGVGALGYLGYSASNENTEARTKYDASLSDLKNLQGGSIYPSDDNLKKVKLIKQGLQAKVDELQKTLSSAKFKVEPISPPAFQDKLKATVDSIAARAVEARVKFPGNEKESEKFYLGFDAYKSTQPKPEAAPALARQLRAIEVAVNQVLEVRNATVMELTRAEVAEEKEVKAAPDPKKGRKPEEQAGGRPRVDRQSFTLRFVASHGSVQRVFNALVGNKEQLYIVRSMTVRNQSIEPPSKSAPGGGPGVAPVVPPPVNPITPPAPAPVAPAPGTPAPDAPAPVLEKKEFIFGKELVDATFLIDIVDVAEPAPVSAPTDKAGAKK